MSRQNRILQLLALAAFSTLAGCSGSDGTTTAGRPPSEADVQAAMLGVVLPAMEQLGFQSASSQQPSAASAAAPSKPGAPVAEGASCFDLDFLCKNGAFEFCADGNAGLHLDWNYDDCAQPDATRDGTWSLDTADSKVSAAFALSVDEVHLAGTVSYAKDASCWTHAVGGFVASGARHTITIDGEALYCPGTRPVGQWELDVAGETTFQASFVFDASVGTLVVVDTEGTVHNCTIDFVARKVSCEEQ